MFAIGSMLTIPLLFIPFGETMLEKIKKNLYEKGIWFPDRECERSKQRNASPPQCPQTLRTCRGHLKQPDRQEPAYERQSIDITEHSPPHRLFSKTVQWSLETSTPGVVQDSSSWVNIIRSGNRIYPQIGIWYYQWKNTRNCNRSFLSKKMFL